MHIHVVIVSSNIPKLGLCTFDAALVLPLVVDALSVRLGKTMHSRKYTLPQPRGYWDTISPLVLEFLHPRIFLPSTHFHPHQPLFQLPSLLQSHQTMDTIIDPAVIERPESPPLTNNVLISSLFTLPAFPAPISGCGVCNVQKDDLIRCTTCKVMFYCCPEHQDAHWPSHKDECNQMKLHMLDTSEIERGNLDFICTFKYMLVLLSVYWGRSLSWQHLERKMKFLGDIAQINTTESVKAQLVGIMELLCGNQAEQHDDLRDIPPALLLRLGCYQECYSLLKCYTFPAANPLHDYFDFGEGDVYGYLSSPNLFEPVDCFLYEPASDIPGSSHTIAHLVFLAILKIRLVFELRKIDSTAALLRKRLPQELVDLILDNVPDHPAISAEPRAMRYASRIELVKSLNVQTLQIYRHVDRLNVHFWGALLNPGNHLQANPPDYKPGSVEEAQLVLARTYREWVLTPGAMDYIVSIRDGQK